MTAVVATALVVTIALSGAGPAEAQGAAVMRIQSQTISGAIGRQIQQAMRPHLQIRNGAGSISELGVGADGQVLAIASADGGIRVWDLESGRQTRRLVAGGARALDVGTVPALAPVRSRGVGTGEGLPVVVTGGADGSATLWDAVSGLTIRQFHGHQGPVLAVRLAPGGALLATAGADQTVRLWDLVSGRQQAVLSGHGGAVTSLAFAASGRLLASGSADGTVRLWTLPGGAAAGTLTAGAPVTALAFGGDDRVAAGTGDGSVRVWSASGASQGSWRAESGPVSSLGLNRSGGVVTAAGGSEAHLWNAGGGTVGRIVDSGNHIALVAFSSDGSRVITGGSSGAAKVWDGTSGQYLAQLILTGTGWAVIDASGRFDGSEGGLGDVSWAADQGVFDIANFSEPYYEPGLLAKTLRAPGALLTGAATPVEAGVGVPPVVMLSSPAGVSAAAGPTTVTVTATDQGGGIDEVRLFQNDKAVDPSHVSNDSGAGRTRTMTYGVELIGGTNSFRATASSSQHIEGQPALLTVRVAAAERKPTLHLVAVGINQYSNPQITLNYAVADAQGFVDWAHKQVNGDFASIQVHSLFDHAATRAAILETFRSLQNTQPEDVVIIYVAGHGENANGNWYFLPTEFGRSMTLAGVAGEGVSSQMFEDGILKMGAERVLLLIDACKSGSLGRAFSADADRKNLQLVSRSAGIHVLAATDKEQLAVELEDLGHGAFTYTVLQGLAGRASPDSVIRAKSVLTYASENVPVIAFKYTNMEQYPTVFSRGSDFEVGRRGR
jgi:WD40 repeat protein